MISFFRKIRLNLLSNGKLLTYLKYAVGEILLVVIGILIALQINNWNEKNKKSLLEQEALYNLKADFQLNNKELEFIIKRTESSIDGIIEILNHTGERNSDEFVLDTKILAAISAKTFNSQDGFLNDLINSGNLGLLKSAKLRSMLSSWAPNLKEQARIEGYLEDSESKLVDFITKNGNWLNIDNLTPSFSNLNIPESGFDVSNNNMLASLEFENLVENCLIYHNNTLKNQRKVLDLSREISKLIQQEIDINKSLISMLVHYPKL